MRTVLFQDNRLTQCMYVQHGYYMYNEATSNLQADNADFIKNFTLLY